MIDLLGRTGLFAALQLHSHEGLRAQVRTGST